MKPIPNSILVLGAGELGTEVLKSLASHPNRDTGVTISVLLRDSTITTQDARKRQHLEEIRELGIDFLPGDIHAENEEELAIKFSQHDLIIGCTGMYSPAGTQLKLTRAVLAAGVQWYIPWQFGLDYDAIGRDSSQDLFTEQLDVRDLLRQQSRTLWIIVSTGISMSSLFEEAFGVIDLGRSLVRALGSWENGVTVTDVPDIGKMVAIVVFEEKLRDQVVYIAGDTVSYDELADMVSKRRNKEVAREIWTVDKLKDELSNDLNDGMRKYTVVFAKGRGVSWNKTKTINGKRNLALTNIKDWLDERAGL